MHQIQESHLNLPWNRVDFCGSICSSCMVYTSMWLNWGAIPQLSVFSFRPPYSRCLLAWRGGRDLGDWLTWLIDWLTDIRYYMMVMMMMMMKSLLRLIHYRIPFREFFTQESYLLLPVLALLNLFNGRSDNTTGQKLLIILSPMVDIKALSSNSTSQPSIHLMNISMAIKVLATRIRTKCFIMFLMFLKKDDEWRVYFIIIEFMQ